jgi:oxaloacetate decarboxylase alpha subunit
MATIEFVDTTVRDGNQSLWGATGLTTGMMLQIAPIMDRVGYAAVDFSTSTHMAVTARFHRENPWERIRLMAAAMPRTPLSFLTTGMRFISWERASDDFMRLTFRLLIRAGIRRFQAMDPMNDADAVLKVARTIVSEGGGNVVAALVYTISPLNDDAYYAERAARFAASPDVDRIYIKDPGGLLTAERARTLVPAILGVIGEKPLELHSHCTIGLAPFSYAVAAELGVGTLHTAAGPLGNGSSQPTAERAAANLRALGHTVDIDDAALAETSAYFTALADAEGLPHGSPSEFDEAYFRHQIPGGMLTTMQRQLAEIRQSDKLPAVFEETARVREELGFPIMVTPFSQVVCTQAVMNVLAGERYANVPDEVMRYMLGRFGAPPGHVDDNVRDRVLSRPRAKELMDESPMPDLADLRERVGKHLDDEEFVLRAVMPAAQIDAMLAAPPVRRTYEPSARPIMTLLRELTKRPAIGSLRVEKPNFSLELARRS